MLFLIISKKHFFFFFSLFQLFEPELSKINSKGEYCSTTSNDIFLSFNQKQFYILEIEKYSN